MAKSFDPDEDPNALSPDEVITLAQFEAEFGNIQVADAGAISKRMSARYDNAKNLDDLFDALEGSSSKQLVGKVFTFLSVAWQRYDSDRGPVPQAVCNVVDVATGEADEFVTTGDMLVKFLANAVRLNAYPFTARIVEKTTKRGRKALNLERA
jgi:hypothetical protein